MPWLRALPKGLHTRPLDFNLHSTHDGEPHIPFSRYVQLEPMPSSCMTFPQFCNLSAELQLRVLYFCNSPTLFQLMQTSYTTRAEAKKLFWTYPDSWYRVNGLWLLAGGYPGEDHHDVDFMTYVERLDVNINYLRPQNWMTYEVNEIWETWGGWPPREDRPLPEAPIAVIQGIEERIRDFWRTLQRRFPRATHVIVSEDMGRKGSRSLPYLFKMIVQMCPTGIIVSASLLQGDGNYSSRQERSLWRQVKGNAGVEDEWEHTIPSWTQQRIILMPPKRFRGPVGAYESIDYKFYHHSLQHTAARVLRIIALERYHFHELSDQKGFGCFAPNCEAYFKRPEEYTLHAIQTGHDASAVPPENVMALFKKNDKRLLRLQKKDDKAWDLIRRYWGEENTEKRRNAEQAFLDQLEHDPLYAQAKPVKESKAWAGIHNILEEWRRARESLTWDGLE